MAVFEGESLGGVEGVFGVKASAVEIVETVGGVKPTAYISAVTHGMGHHVIKCLARMAALRGGIGHSNAFGRLGHCAEVYRKTIGMANAIIPHLIGNGLDSGGGD